MLRKVRRVETENREGEDDRRIGGKSEFEKCAQLKMERKVRPIKRPRKKSFRIPRIFPDSEVFIRWKPENDSWG